MTAPGAVRYLTRMKNETKDPAMKANAKKAIANFEEIFLTEKNEEISYLCLSDWM